MTGDETKVITKGEMQQLMKRDKTDEIKESEIVSNTREI